MLILTEIYQRREFEEFSTEVFPFLTFTVDQMPCDTLAVYF